MIDHAALIWSRASMHMAIQGAVEESPLEIHGKHSDTQGTAEFSGGQPPYANMVRSGCGQKTASTLYLKFRYWTELNRSWGNFPARPGGDGLVMPACRELGTEFELVHHCARSMTVCDPMPMMLIMQSLVVMTYDAGDALACYSERHSHGTVSNWKVRASQNNPSLRVCLRVWSVLKGAVGGRSHESLQTFVSKFG